jgi:hypothetical protein
MRLPKYDHVLEGMLIVSNGNQHPLTEPRNDVPWLSGLEYSTGLNDTNGFISKSC